MDQDPKKPASGGGLTASQTAAYDALSASPSRTLLGDAWRRLSKNKLAIVAIVWIVVMVVAAISADLWVPRLYGDPIAINTQTLAVNHLLPPSFVHPFGTDELGRDVFSRVVYGARFSLAVGLIATAISILIGLILGALAGYYGGLTDAFVMRTADVFFAFPYTLFAIAMIAVLGPGFINVFLAIGILGWPSIARVFRSSILSVKQQDYIQAARALGASDIRIMTRHILPNSVAPIIVYGTMSIGGAILTEAALSFLGMGIQPPTPSWGYMINASTGYLLTAPWLMLWPGFAILTTVLAFVLLGDGLRDALDVKMKD